MTTPRNRALRGLTIVMGFAVALSYWIGAPFLPTDAQTEWLRIFELVFAIGVMLAFAPGIWEIVVRPSPPEAQRYVLGTLFVWSGICGGAAWLLLWRAADMPQWMVQSDVNGFWIWLIFVGSVYHLTAVLDDRQTPPRTNVRRLVVCAILSLLLGLVVTMARPDARSLTDWLRPHLSVLTGTHHG